MKKILIIHKNAIYNEPPTQMVLQNLLDIGYKVKLVTLGTNDYWSQLLNSKGVEVVDLGLNYFVDSKKRLIKDKLKVWWKYRLTVKHELEKVDTDTTVWFVDADSLAPLLKISELKNINYIMHILETYDTSSFYRYIIKNNAIFAKKMVVCEENRAAIFNAWFRPNFYPTVLPNKPYKLLSINDSEEFIKKNIPELYKKIFIDKAKIILYQGNLSIDRDLSFILKSIDGLSDEFIPVLMGKDYGVLKKYKQICSRVIHIPHIPAPLHLHITSHSRIGILMYDPISLNQIFCAPNKIFEYSGYGLPMIGNNIPGLSNPFEKFNMGMVFKKEDSEEFRKLILEIDSNYDYFSKNATAFYNRVNTKEIIQEILSDNLL